MSGEALLIRAVTVVDGTGAGPSAPRDVLIEDGRIAAIDDRTAVENVAILDGAGRYLVPGLWETEAHLTRSANGLPADLLRKWPEDGDVPRLRANLRAYLASGVTSVVDLGGPTEVLTALREEQRRGDLLGARLFVLGRQFTAKGGQPVIGGSTLAGVTTQVDDAEEVRRIATAMIERDRVDGLKVNYTTGGGPFGRAPIISPECLAALVEVARAHDLPLFAHIDDADRAAVALEAGVGNIQHMFDPRPGRFEADVERVGALCVERGAFWSMTLSWFESYARAGDPSLLDDIGVEGRVEPAVLKELTEDPRSMWRTMPGEMRAYFKARLEAADSVLAAVNRRGVPTSVATDAGNPMVFHGAGALREMVLMQAAGVPPLEVLCAATSRAAEKVGRLDQLGTVAVGKVADLLLLDADPTADVANVRRLAAVIQEGVVHAPADLRL
ncbi:MAG: amidohydrolase family protein [Actinobacteria bacterium]|nr:amidohydrolase family protein [Actinomycetota bacterium]